MPSRILEEKSLFEVLCPTIPLFRIPVRVFGCTCFVHVPKHQRDKLDPKAVKCFVFFGTQAVKRGANVTLLEKGRIFVTMDVSFYEDVLFTHLLVSKVVVRKVKQQIFLFLISSIQFGQDLS